MLNAHVCPPLVRAIATNLSGMCVCFVLSCMLTVQVTLLVWHVCPPLVRAIATNLFGMCVCFDSTHSMHVECSRYVACLACLSSIGEGDCH